MPRAEGTYGTQKSSTHPLQNRSSIGRRKSGPQRVDRPPDRSANGWAGSEPDFKQAFQVLAPKKTPAAIAGVSLCVMEASSGGLGSFAESAAAASAKQADNHHPADGNSAADKGHARRQFM